MKKTTLFEETSDWCSINMAEGLVKQRFEKTGGKSRKSPFLFWEKLKSLKVLFHRLLQTKLTSLAQRDTRSGKHQIHGLEKNRLVIQILRQK